MLRTGWSRNSADLDWRVYLGSGLAKKLDELPVDRKQARLAEELSGLAKVADAIKGFPLGQQLIVWGIVILIIGGLFGGVSGIIASKSC
jgi:hypothetical protein